LEFSLGKNKWRGERLGKALRHDNNKPYFAYQKKEITIWPPGLAYCDLGKYLNEAKFTKNGYSLESILDSAEGLKYIKAIKNEFDKELQNPSDELVKMLVSRFFDKPLIASRLAVFKDYTNRAISNYINETISSRLKNALSINENIPSKDAENIESIDDNAIVNEKQDSIVTTEEEMEGFQIIKAILREAIPASRIAQRDTKSYFGILLDDNNRKPIARLHFNASSAKYIELFDKGKDNGERKLISSVDDIYQYRQALLDTIKNYE